MNRGRVVEECTREAVQILRRMNELRGVDPKGAWRVYTFEELANAPLLSEGQPEPDATPSEVYAAGIRFWARAVARQLDLQEWNVVVEAARRAVEDFDGDATRFFEEAFEGLTLADGVEVYP